MFTAFSFDTIPTACHLRAEFNLICIFIGVFPHYHIVVAVVVVVAWYTTDNRTFYATVRTVKVLARLTWLMCFAIIYVQYEIVFVSPLDFSHVSQTTDPLVYAQCLFKRWYERKQ